MPLTIETSCTQPITRDITQQKIDDSQPLPQTDKEKGLNLLQRYAEKFQIPKDLCTCVNPELFYLAHKQQLSPEQTKAAIVAQNIQTLFQTASKENQKLLEEAFINAYLCEQYFNNINPILSLALYADVETNVVTTLYENNLTEIVSILCPDEQEEDSERAHMKILMLRVIEQAKNNQLYVDFETIRKEIPVADIL